MQIPWVIEEQTKVKHALLDKYVSPWMAIFFRTQQQYNFGQVVVYIDAFAGPGIYYTDSLMCDTCHGSPLIVANKANEYICQNPNRAVHILCGDTEKQCVDMLQRKLDEANTTGQSWQVYHGDFQKTILKIMAYIRQSKLGEYPLFFFIDPFGYSGYPISILKQLLEFPRAELFINFMVYDIVRFIDESPFQQRLIEQFGDESYRQALQASNPEEKQAFIINTYCNNLKKFAGATFVMPFRINTPGLGTRPRFYMIHASKNYKALKVMKDSMASVSEVPYRFEAIGVTSPQLSLFEDPHKLDLVERINSYCKDCYPLSTDYDNIEEWAYANTNGISKTIKAALKELEGKTLQIKRLPRQRENTVNSGAQIKYIGN